MLPFLWVYRDRAGLLQPLGDHHVAEGAVQPRHLDQVEAMVCPVYVTWKKKYPEVTA